MIRIALGFSLALSTSASAFDLKTCETFANAGLVDTRDVSLVEEQASNDFDYVCTEEGNFVGRARERNSGLSVSYAGFGVGFAQGRSEAETSEIIKNMCREGKSAFLANTISRESVREGHHVVGLIESCVETLSERNVEALLGWTKPSTASDSFFTMHFRFQAGIDARQRTYQLVRADVDETAQLYCYQDEGGQRLDIQSQEIRIQNETSVSCQKAAGVSINGILAFRASDDPGRERLVHFNVESPQGSEIVRQELQAEFESQIAELRAQLAAESEQRVADVSRLGDGLDSLNTAIGTANSSIASLTNSTGSIIAGVICPTGYVEVARLAMGYHSDATNKLAQLGWLHTPGAGPWIDTGWSAYHPVLCRRPQ